MCQEPCVHMSGCGRAGVWDGEAVGSLSRLHPDTSLWPSLGFSFIHGLEWRLLNVSFGGHNLTLKTHTIQTLAFKLGCNFTGLSLSSDTLERVPQVRGGQGWGS